MCSFKSYKNEELVNYVINNPKVESILTDEEFLNYILKPENNYAFIWLLYGLHDNKKLTNAFLNKTFLSEILNDKLAVNKYEAILSQSAYVLEDANEDVISFLINTNKLYYSFTYLNLVVANKLLDYIVEKDNDKAFVLAKLSTKVQDGLFNPTNMEKLLKLESLKGCCLSFAPSVIVKLFEHKEYKNLILNLSQDKFDYLASKFENYEIPAYIQNNKELIKALSSVENPSYFRSIVNHLKINNFVLANTLEEERKNYVQDLFNTLNNDGVFQKYIDFYNYLSNNGINYNMYNSLPAELHLNNLDNNALKMVTKKRLFENMCDLFFKDYPKNVLLNIKQVMNFLKFSKEELVPSERKIIYNLILNFGDLSINEIKELYKNLSKTPFLSSLLYEDIRNCRDRSYQLFNESFLKLKNSSNLKDEMLSKKTGLDVYVLDGSDFTACVHVGKISKESPKKTISLSIIGSKCIGTFYYDDVIVGFEHLVPNRIMHVYKSDSYSSGIDGTVKVNEIYTPDALLRQTASFNEVLYNEMSNGVLLPSYVVCKDEIDLKSIDYAKENNLPIVLLNTKKYYINFYQSKDEDYQQSASESLTENYFSKSK